MCFSDRSKDREIRHRLDTPLLVLAYRAFAVGVVLSLVRDARTIRFAPLVLAPLQVAATGEEALEKLEELEMIFGAVSELGGLERCTSLRSLTREWCPLIETQHIFALHEPSTPLNPLLPFSYHWFIKTLGSHLFFSC